MPDRTKSESIFKVIQGGKEKSPPKEAILFECRVCEKDLGHSTTSIIQVRTMPMIHKGRITGGHKVWVCATCLSRGKHTPVL